MFCASINVEKEPLCCELCIVLHIQVTEVAVDPTNSLGGIPSHSHRRPHTITQYNHI